MRNLAMKDLYKTHYNLEPSLSQKYSTLMTLPQLIKIVTGVVIDARLVSNRKQYFMVMSLVQFVTLAMGIVVHPSLRVFNFAMFVN